jgi:hypothetical protein
MPLNIVSSSLVITYSNLIFLMNCGDRHQHAGFDVDERVAATRNSTATSRFRLCITSRVVRYYSVMAAIGISVMLSSFFLIKWSRRSSGPSKIEEGALMEQKAKGDAVD